MAKLIQDIHLGKNLKRLRKANGLTQEAVCAKLAALGRPMVRSTYAQIETGDRNLFISDLIALKTLYNVPYEEFFRDLTPINKYEQGYR